MHLPLTSEGGTKAPRGAYFIRGEPLYSSSDPYLLIFVIGTTFLKEVVIASPLFGSSPAPSINSVSVTLPLSKSRADLLVNERFLSAGSSKSPFISDSAITGASFSKAINALFFEKLSACFLGRVIFEEDLEYSLSSGIVSRRVDAGIKKHSNQ